MSNTFKVGDDFTINFTEDEADSFAFDLATRDCTSGTSYTAISVSTVNGGVPMASFKDDKDDICTLYTRHLVPVEG